MEDIIVESRQVVSRCQWIRLMTCFLLKHVDTPSLPTSYIQIYESSNVVLSPWRKLRCCIQKLLGYFCLQLTLTARGPHSSKNDVCRRQILTKWNESGFRPPLCTYRLSWARRTSWGLWDDWDDTVLQTQDSKSEPWRSEAEHATSRSRRLATILTFTRGWGRNIFCFFQTAETGNRTPNSGVKGSGANH